MISNSWNKSEGKSISQKIISKVKPDQPLNSKLDSAQKGLQVQISKLSIIDEKLQKKHGEMFDRIVKAKTLNQDDYAKAYAIELAQIRQTKNKISGAKLALEQIKLRLSTVSELGDVVVTLSPCMSIIKGLSPSLSGIMPEANAAMADMSQILGDVMAGSSITGGDNVSVSQETNDDSLAILEEAHNVIAGQTKTAIPDIPDNLRQQIANKKSDILI